MKSIIVMITVGFCLVYSQNAPTSFLNGTNHHEDHRNRRHGSSLVSLIDSAIAKKDQGSGICFKGQDLSFNGLHKAISSSNQIYLPDTVIVYSTGDTSRYTASYSIQGMLTRGLYEKLVNRQWTNCEQERLTYDADGNTLYEFDERWLGGQWTKDVQNTYSYGAKGNKLSELNEQWSNGQLWKSRYTYIYGANGKIQSELEEQWLNGEVWTNNRTYNYTYDSDGNKVSELVEQWLHGQWTNYERFTYTYDALGKMLSTLDEQWSNGQWTNYLKYSYTYDAHGNMFSELVAYWSYGQWTYYLQYTYTYDGYGNMLSELMAYWSDGRWNNYIQDTYTYDAHGNKLSGLEAFWLYGQWTNVSLSLLTYDSYGNLILESFAIWSGSSWDPTDGSFTIHAGNYQYPVQGCTIKIEYAFLNTTDVSALMNNKAANYSLSQNYPNPFNPSTNIGFNLPSKAFVLLKVYDILGREVATLMNEELSAGSYTRQWNAANMPSGIYFYRLQAGSYGETKKLILLR